MKLRDLEAEFLQVSPTKPGEPRSYHRVEQLADADGIWFVCPKCRTERGRREGVHGVICWFRGRVPDDMVPGPGRWTPKGTGLDDLTFVPGEPKKSVSVHLTSGCGWHGHVRNGEATLK